MAYKILIVDDEKMMTELLSDHLRDCGYDTITANCFRRERYFMVILSFHFQRGNLIL